MDKEIYKQLHDAGFRKDHEFDDKTASYCLRCPFIESYTKSEPEDGFTFMCYPTLSELIEACGYRLTILENWGDGWSAYEESMDLVGIETKGSTPEEAVARLYIALNKK